jgi:hypothetical protein
MLRRDECYRQIKPVEIGPVLTVLDRLQFVAVGQSAAGKYRCDVAFASFPPELLALISGLGLGGHQARAVVRKLQPRQAIPLHTDSWMPQERDWRRFQVPLVTDQSVVMRWPADGQEAHLATGHLYEVRFDRPHEVVNGWDGERLHLQVDQVNATI